MKPKGLFDRPVTSGTCVDLNLKLTLGVCAGSLSANMDYVVDDVVRQVAVNSSSSAGRLRGQGSRGSAAIVLRSRRGGNRSGETEIPAVVEVVLRIGGPAMGPALVGLLCERVLEGDGLYRLRMFWLLLRLLLGVLSTGGSP